MNAPQIAGLSIATRRIGRIHPAAPMSVEACDRQIAAVDRRINDLDEMIASANSALVVMIAPLVAVNFAALLAILYTASRMFWFRVL